MDDSEMSGHRMQRARPGQLADAALRVVERKLEILPVAFDNDLGRNGEVNEPNVIDDRLQPNQIEPDIEAVGLAPEAQGEGDAAADASSSDSDNDNMGDHVHVMQDFFNEANRNMAAQELNGQQ